MYYFNVTYIYGYTVTPMMIWMIHIEYLLRMYMTSFILKKTTYGELLQELRIAQASPYQVI